MNGFRLSLAAALAFSGSLVAGQGPPPAAPVVVETVRELDFTPRTLLLGSTEPKRSSLVAAEIEGNVVEYTVDEGQWIKKDDLLVRLDDTILTLQLAEADARIAEIRERHRRARLDLERAEKLRAEDATTQKALDDAVTAEKTLSLQIPQAEARIAVLKADIAKKRVLAPFDGQVVEEHTELGEWMAKGGAVAQVVDLASVRIRVNVPERFIRYMKKGDKAPVFIPAAAAPSPFKGTIIAVSGRGDTAARTFPVLLEVANTAGLGAGMSARVELPTGTPRKALAISKDALLLQGGKSAVFLVTPAGVVERRSITAGSPSGNTVEVAEGLAPGDRVVVRGNERLRPGMPVRLLEGDKP